ncbi:MAG: hypothetical protein AB7N76_25580 [Planctomycetota bacterium]
MTPTRLAGALLLAVQLPTFAAAQDLPGQYDLGARYSNQRRASVQLDIKESAGRYRVTRTSRYTSAKYKGLPAFTWTSSEAKRNGRLLVVRYETGSDQDLDGIASHLTPSSSSAQVLQALAAGNVFRAVYVLSSDGKSLRETVYNTTRQGDQSFWRWIQSSGKKQAAPTGPGLSDAAFAEATRDSIEAWYRDYIEEGYADELASAATAAERQRLEDRKQADLDFDSAAEIMDGDDYWDDEIDDQYSNGQKYRDDFGQEIPRKDVVVKALSFFPELAGIGLSKVFVFHRVTGKLLDEGDVQD